MKRRRKKYMKLKRQKLTKIFQEALLRLDFKVKVEAKKQLILLEYSCPSFYAVIWKLFLTVCFHEREEDL